MERATSCSTPSSFRLCSSATDVPLATCTRRPLLDASAMQGIEQSITRPEAGTQSSLAAQCLKQAKRLFGPRPGSPLASSGLRNPETPLAPHGPTLQRVDPSSRHAIACRLFDDQENSCPSAPPARLVLTST